MVKYTNAQLDRTFAALSDTTRRAILARLTKGEATVGELARPFGISWPAVTKHLHVLENAGLIGRTREGRVHRCRFQPKPLDKAQAWINHHRQFWESQLDSLAEYLNHTSSKE